MRHLVLVAMAGATLARSGAAAPDAGPAQVLGGIVAAYEVLQAERDPISAGQRGDLAAARRWPDDSPSGVARRQERLAALDRQLHTLAEEGLAGEDRLNRALLEIEIQTELDGMAFDERRMPFTSDESFFNLPAEMAGETRLRSLDEAQAYLDRLAALPAFYATEIANMRRGCAAGFTQPRFAVDKAASFVAASVAAPAEQSPLLAPIAALPETVPAPDRARLRAKALDIISTRIKPAESALASYFTRDYAACARTALGVGSLPGGRVYYAHLVRRETTTDLTPDRVNALGLAEIARIRTEMEAAMRETGFTGSLQAFLAQLRRDPKFFVASREALLDKASRLAKQVDDRLPAFFGKLPRLPYGVRPVPREIEEGYTSARYFPGSPEQGIAGGLMINTSHLDQRPLYELPALVAHEGAPGHHIQIALAQELAGVPSFRRDYDNTAFVEGWALYAEQLGREMGLYATPAERFGLLSMEMWRACRLVVDTGIHWMGWSRAQAEACLRDNTALAEQNIQVEIDRYVTWPGQALGYKIGQLEFAKLRQRAERALGPKFDLRAFHDAVLDEGALPLSLLERRIDAWIASRKG